VCIAPKDVLMMPQPGDDRATRRVGRSRLRASHADRDHVVDTLKDAFVQGRLTKDEFDSRVGHTLAARTHADLATLTADLPAMPPVARPPRKLVPARPANTAVKNGARVIAATTVLTAGVWVGALSSQIDGQLMGTLVWAFTFLWLGIVVLVGAVMLESRLQKRSGGQLPPAPGDRGPASPGGVSADPPGQLRPGRHGRQEAAEASQSPIARPLLLLEPRFNPS
jgi:hypothetical protein